MEFSYLGRPHVIEFSRRYREGFKSRYPYTTATISEITGPQETKVVRTWTSGCYFRDNFTYEDGRKAALRGALYDSPTGDEVYKLPKAFKSAAWASYFKRWKDGQKRVSKYGKVMD